MTNEDIHVDVAIIGGGIQGAWLLADLAGRGYQAVLLERERPGAGQTGHSHVFLHQGHMRATARAKEERVEDAVGRMAPLRNAYQVWRHELDGGMLSSVRYKPCSFYVGWQEEQRASFFRAACREAEIPCEPADEEPRAFAACKTMFQCEGICLESDAVLGAILKQRDLNERVARCEDLEVLKTQAGGFRLSMRSAGSNGSAMVCGAVVLCAGAGNEHLVREVFPSGGIHLNTQEARQQTVKTYMLAVRTQRGAWNPACGMFFDHSGIFVAHREDEQGRIVWLIGDGQRRHVGVPGQWPALDARAWFRGLKPSLERLMPALLSSPGAEFGIYEAAKAEPWTVGGRGKRAGVLPDLYRAAKSPDHNVWVVWPTFLTFAPVVASEVGKAIEGAPIPQSAAIGGRTAWDAFRSGNMAPAMERWKSTPMLDWHRFSVCYA